MHPWCSYMDSHTNLVLSNLIKQHSLYWEPCYSLLAAANPCTDNNPCDVANGYCNLDSNNVEQCSCKRGYFLDTVDASTCHEVDECALGLHGCAQNCTNTVGAYKCSCFEGYYLSSNKRDCLDLNECVLGTYSCHISQSCVNTPGSYKCECTSGNVWRDGACRRKLHGLKLKGLFFCWLSGLWSPKWTGSLSLVLPKEGKCQTTIVMGWSCTFDSSCSAFRDLMTKLSCMTHWLVHVLTT